MSGGINYGANTKAMTVEAFKEWVRGASPEELKERFALFGKPRVRVPVDRQTPNEADL